MSLMEKAYAKLHKGYRPLEWGNMNDAMCDLTGGCPFAIRKGEVTNRPPPYDKNMFEWPSAVFNVLRSELQRRNVCQLFGAIVDPACKSAAELAQLATVGLSHSHYYCLVKHFSLSTQAANFSCDSTAPRWTVVAPDLLAGGYLPGLIHNVCEQRVLHSCP
jgi:hypothetical protein